MNETEKTENEKSSYPQSSIREDLSSAESRSGSRDDEVHSGVDRANVKVKILQVAGYVWQTLQAVREKAGEAAFNLEWNRGNFVSF